MRKTKIPDTNKGKLEYLISEIAEINELLRGIGHEGMLHKVEKHDKFMYKMQGFFYLLTPATIIAVILGIFNIIVK